MSFVGKAVKVQNSAFICKWFCHIKLIHDNIHKKLSTSPPRKHFHQERLTQKQDMWIMITYMFFYNGKNT